MYPTYFLAEFGPCIFSFSAFGAKMYSSGWKGHVSCKVMMSLKEKEFILEDLRTK
jgi:hypothetical protein